VGDLRLDQELRHMSGLLSGIAILLYGIVLVVGLVRGPEPVRAVPTRAVAVD
jgi:hypothetical protein